MTDRLWTIDRLGVHEHVTEDYRVTYAIGLPSFEYYYADSIAFPGSHVVKPTFYLNPDVKIKEDTDGAKDNPFILDHELINQ